MVILIVVAWVTAVTCAFYAWTARAKVHAMITTETLTAQELGALHQAAVQAAGHGVFRQSVEVAGQLEPGPSGHLRSDLAGVECVWHRHVVTRTYMATRRGSDGRNERTSRTETVSQRFSETPFQVRDATGAVTVLPGLIDPDGAQKVLDWFSRANSLVNVFDDGSDLGGTIVGTGVLGPGTSSSPSSGTEGYKYEEWILSPGQRIFVLGEASDERGELAVIEPSIISTSGETELLDRTRSQLRLCTIGAAAAGAGGLVLSVFGLLV